MLLAVAVEQCDRVAVGDAHDLALEDITSGGEAPRDEKEQRLRSNGTKRMAVFSWFCQCTLG